jgi:hypothetical protein
MLRGVSGPPHLLRADDQAAWRGARGGEGAGARHRAARQSGCAAELRRASRHLSHVVFVSADLGAVVSCVLIADWLAMRGDSAACQFIAKELWHQLPSSAQPCS